VHELQVESRNIGKRDTKQCPKKKEFVELQFSGKEVALGCSECD